MVASIIKQIEHTSEHIINKYVSAFKTQYTTSYTIWGNWCTKGNETIISFKYSYV